MAKTYRYTVLFFGWMALITYLSLASLSGSDISNVNIPHKDKIAHFAFYFGMVLLGCFFLRERTRGRLGIKKGVLLMFLTAFFYGIIIEVLQAKTTVDRDGNWLDAMANTVGAIVGCMVVGRLFSKSGRLNWEH